MWKLLCGSKSKTMRCFDGKRFVFVFFLFIAGQLLNLSQLFSGYLCATGILWGTNDPGRRRNFTTWIDLYERSAIAIAIAVHNLIAAVVHMRRNSVEKFTISLRFWMPIEKSFCIININKFKKMWMIARNKWYWIYGLANSCCVEKVFRVAILQRRCHQFNFLSIEDHFCLCSPVAGCDICIIIHVLMCVQDVNALRKFIVYSIRHVNWIEFSHF